MKSDGGIEELPSWTGPGKIVRRREAVAATPFGIAGQAVPAVAGTRFLALAEVHSSAVDFEGVPSVLSTNGQCCCFGSYNGS